MRTNQEKWDHYKKIIDKKTNSFIESQEKMILPKQVYYVYQSGKLIKRDVLGLSYSHHKHEGNKTYFYGKKPSKDDVNLIKVYSEMDIPFSVDNLYVEYSEVWDVEKNWTSKSSMKYSDVINEVNVFISLEKAEKLSKDLTDKETKRKEFLETHKKDVNYNYSANGYKFLVKN